MTVASDMLSADLCLPYKRLCQTRNTARYEMCAEWDLLLAALDGRIIGGLACACFR